MFTASQLSLRLVFNSSQLVLTINLVLNNWWSSYSHFLTQQGGNNAPERTFVLDDLLDFLLNTAHPSPNSNWTLITFCLILLGICDGDSSAVISKWHTVHRPKRIRQTMMKKWFRPQMENGDGLSSLALLWFTSLVPYCVYNSFNIDQLKLTVTVSAADGFAYTLGIFIVEFMWYFDEGSERTSWVASIMVGVTLGSGKLDHVKCRLPRTYVS